MLMNSKKFAITIEAIVKEKKYLIWMLYLNFVKKMMLIQQP